MFPFLKKRQEKEEEQPVQQPLHTPGGYGTSLRINDAAASCQVYKEIPMELCDYTPSSYKPGVVASLFFLWITPLLKIGNSRILEFSDLYALENSDTPHMLYEKVYKEYLKNKNTKILWLLFRSFYPPFIAAGVLKLIHDLLNFIPPLMIKYLVYFLMDSTKSLNEGLMYVGVIFLGGIIQSLCLRHYFYYCFLTGMRCRSAISTLVYEKTLCLSAYAAQDLVTGEIINLLSIDAQRVQDVTPYIHALWYTILQIVIATYFLYRQLGISCFAGMLIILLSIPFTSFVSRCLRKFQAELMKKKDVRTRLCNEILQGMKVIKLQAWEDTFLLQIQDYRQAELKQLRTYLLLQTFFSSWTRTVPSIVALTSFLTYVALGNNLEIGIALASIALFNILRFPLFMLPNVINNAVEASVSFSRIDKYLKLEERTIVQSGNLKDTGLVIVNGSFGYCSSVQNEKVSPISSPKEKSSMLQKTKNESTNATVLLNNAISLDTNLRLRNVNLEVQKGAFVAIVGGVGSGKSTLLNAILGNARCLEGSIYVQGSIAYVGQQPFIQNATVRDNILFYKPYDAALYLRAIRASALIKDIKIFPNGDSTEIGEKGITLSGGQRVRISLARAMYQDCDMYLLDDILAAVDVHVGRHIFFTCIVNELKAKGKTIIMVTNNMAYLDSCDEIIVVEDGEIKEKGSYPQLVSEKGLFSKMVETHFSAVHEEQNETNNSEKEETLSVVSETTSNKDSDMRRSSSVSSDGSSLLELPMAVISAVEERAVGEVSKTIYLQWAKACGGYGCVILVIVLYICALLLGIATTYWLSLWSQGYGGYGKYFYIYGYVILNVASAVFMFLRLLSLYLFSLRASRKLFTSLIFAILHSPMSFFDITPLGRIINRLAKDIYVVDEQIPSTMNMYLGCLIDIMGTIVMISVVMPLSIFALVPLAIGYYFSQQYFIKTSRELQRLENISRSPIYSLLDETLDGMVSLHAYRAEEKYRMRNFELLEKNQRAYFLNFSANCWLAIRLEFAGTLIASCASLAAVLSPDRSVAFAGMAGVVLSYAFSVTQSLNWSVRMASQLETQMVSVERIKEYNDMPNEPIFQREDSYVNSSDMRREVIVPPFDWPSKGDIEFCKISIRYRPGLPYVLQNVCFSVKSGEKIGICGRTGSGKSSLFFALMRLVECASGQILIDNVDISRLRLQRLRKSIASIPQDPVLFKGTIRWNLDPFNEYDDNTLWNAIRRVHLKNVIHNLDFEVKEQGSNLSTGERQLLCIARAILKRSKIILMDEATASIDVTTAHLLRESMETEFTQSTCLIIAHRLDTIINSDKVLVMDKGSVAEYDQPNVLLNRSGSIFRSLVADWKKKSDEVKTDEN